MTELDAFLLSTEWRDLDTTLELTLWASSPTHGPIRATIPRQEAVMFVPRHEPTQAGRRERRPLRTLQGMDVDALYFSTRRALLREADRLRKSGTFPLESDLKPTHRYTMERFINGGLHLRGEARKEHGVLRFHDPHVRAAEVTPRLRTLSLDVETDGWDGRLLSLAFAGCGLERTIAVPSPEDERPALEAAFALIRELDPDVLLGWNVTDFDLRAIEARATAVGVPFAIGRAGETARVLIGTQQPSIARVPGRVVLDGVATLRNASISLERYTLDFVAKSMLGRGKLRAEGVDPLAEIRRMHREDPAALAAYNLEDARLALEIFDKADLVEFTVARCKLTGLPLDRQGGSVAAFDHLYLPRLHRKGYVAPDVGIDTAPVASPGGHVLDSAPGLYRNVVSFDFRSLYPSIIRTFQIDPLGLWVRGPDPIEGFEGARFAREGAILPALITSLHGERNKAREAKNATMSQAIKILMNSFYGVLGTPGCRFFDPRLASSITLRGHEVIERSRAFFEQRGHRVIYGDTDSLFVQLPEALDEAAVSVEAESLAAAINAWWAETIRVEHRLESHLELRVDSRFLQFLMPTTRGSERGSKKRYAGLVRRAGGTTEVLIRGLEAVRTDWTPLAREAQRELLRRVFVGEPWHDWLLELRRQLLAGARDHELVYRKRLRRDVGDYASAAPHVKAARLAAESASDTESHATDVEYLITARGPEPRGLLTAPLDYRHYLERQLAPALDVVLTLLGTSFDREAGEQLRLL
ncbi:MAG: DNA polymerase II [Archangiaceae bacterium]|nr:DNA polymerase II [Archangiaceae bacterium]